jgi:hypothetical protein
MPVLDVSAAVTPDSINSTAKLADTANGEAGSSPVTAPSPAPDPPGAGFLDYRVHPPTHNDNECGSPTGSPTRRRWTAGSWRTSA